MRSKLIALVRSDMKNDNVAAVYEKLIVELNNMSNYEFNRLKRKI